MRVQQKDNFYSFRCDAIGVQMRGRFVPGIANYAGCQLVVSKVRLGHDHGMWPECRRAIETNSCPAKKMISKELTKGPIYYVDRDDCGPGVIKRAQQGREARSDDEIAFHHQLLAALDLAPYAGPKPTKPVRKAGDSFPEREQTKHRPNRPKPKLSLGEMISDAAKGHVE